MFLVWIGKIHFFELSFGLVAYFSAGRWLSCIVAEKEKHPELSPGHKISAKNCLNHLRISLLRLEFTRYSAACARRASQLQSSVSASQQQAAASQPASLLLSFPSYAQHYGHFWQFLSKNKSFKFGSVGHFFAWIFEILNCTPHMRYKSLFLCKF